MMETKNVQGLYLIFWHSGDEVTGELCETCDQVSIGEIFCIDGLPEIIEPRPDRGTRLSHTLPGVNILPEVVGDLVKDLFRCIGCYRAEEVVQVGPGSG